MECRFCTRFCESKWRINPDTEEKKNSKNKLRHCNVIQQYIHGNREKCDHFEPHHFFWCEENNYWIGVAACVTKKHKGYDATCSGCSQYKQIMELHKTRIMWVRKQKLLEESDSVPAKSTLLRRRSDND